MTDVWNIAEIVQQIILFNGSDAAIDLAYTCKRLYGYVARNDALWRLFYQQQFSRDPNQEMNLIG